MTHAHHDMRDLSQLSAILATVSSQKKPNSQNAGRAANDNKPREPVYRGTLPALRWLYDNRPELAPAFASALPRGEGNWFVEVEPTRQEIRPTIGEVMKASHDDENQPLPAKAKTLGAHCYVTMGRLNFRDGQLIVWGVTKKGRKLKPADRTRPTGDKAQTARNPSSYLRLKGSVASPMAAEHCHRSFSGEPAIASMYDPLPGVESARALLKSLGVDGSKAAPPNTTYYPTATAEGAGFLGGVCSPSGNSSSGAVMWEAPEEKCTDTRAVIEEVAARGTLKSIGLRLGYSEADALDAGKRALIDAAEIMRAIRERKSAA